MRFGGSGAGHYVKMVHNGVEYGLMQAYAEGFDVFDKSEYELDNAKIAHLWNQGSVVRSWLCELAARAFEADGNELQAIEGFTEDSGEGRWTIEDATAKDVPTPVITASLYERLSSRGNGDFAHRVLAALRNQFGGHAVEAGTKAVTAVAVEPENPLTAGLERLPVAPTTLVIFGATGDLARRKLLPALYNLAHDGALPERFHLVGVARREKENADYREDCEQAIRQFSRRTPDEEVLKRLLEHVKYVPGTFDDERVYSKLEKVLDRFEERDGEPLNRAFYLSTAPSFFPVIVEALGKQGLDRHERTDVRVVIEKPFGTSLEEARELNRRVLGSVRGAAGVPHRPLPGQGDGAEHDGVPLRQRHVRAAVEPQLHRPGADHRGGGHRDRHARRLLRPRWRAARPDPEPHAAAALPRGDGAAGELHGR